MSEAYWLDDFTTLDLETEDGATPTPVAGIQDVEIAAEVSIERLYTADSIKIESQKQQEASVNVSIGYSKFDGEFAKEWLGGDGPSATALEDTSDPQKFQLTGSFDSVSGDSTVDITVTGITFETNPLIGASRGEFVQWDLDGTGEDVTNFDVIDNTTE